MIAGEALEILERVGLKLTMKDHLGTGGYGAVFQVSCREVVKVTGELRDVQNALFTMDNWHPAFPVVSRVITIQQCSQKPCLNTRRCCIDYHGTYLIFKEALDNLDVYVKYDQFGYLYQTAHMKDAIEKLKVKPGDDSILNRGQIYGMQVWRDIGQFEIPAALIPFKGWIDEQEAKEQTAAAAA